MMSDKPKTILIVEGDFYKHFANLLRQGAVATLVDAGYEFETIQVPGALEIAPVIAMGIKSKKYSGFIALGTVIRGETTHYDYVAGEPIRALQDLMVQHHVAIGTGILTVEDKEQAEARAHPERGNKGGKAVEACLALIAARKQIKG